MCVGIDFCSKKNCLEQERCVFNVPRHIEWVEPQKGPKKKRNKTASNEPKINLCQMHKKFCSNQRACEVLGQCILDHPLVKDNKQALRQLRRPRTLNDVVKIISRLMPSLNRIGRRRFYKSEKNNRH